MSTTPAPLTGLGNDIDVEAIRARYAVERDRRLRPDGAAQYQPTRGAFGYYAADPYTPRADREPLTDSVDVLVIGAGFGGLLVGARLRQAGVESIRLLDEAGDVGGTWYWNRYPGIHCDIQSYVYMPLLEEVGTMPDWRYAPGEEIRQHAVRIATKFDLYRDAVLQTRATKLTWDEDAEDWIVETDRGDRIRAHSVITSSGTLTQPKLPGIPGIETFRGHTFHTSRWDYDYTDGDQFGGLSGLTDKRVAIVGTGATGVQVIPFVAEDAGHLFVFQRTPSSVDVRDNAPTDRAWAETLRPGWQRVRQDNFLSVVSGEPTDVDLTRDGWTSTAQLQRKVVSGAVARRVPEEERERLDELIDAQKMNEIRARVDREVDDPETAELLKPWYRYMCKRPTFSDRYLPTFNRQNVTLVDTANTGGITRMTETSIVVGNREFEVDCVIFATGFEVGVSGVVSGSLPVVGRDGKTLLESWRRGPRTLHGTTSHGFPNLFHLSGVQSPNAVNFVHILQDQAEHVTALITAAGDAGASYVEPTEEAEDAWAQTIQDTATDNSRFQVECTPGYYNGEGTRTDAGGRAGSYSPGPVAFSSLIRTWRDTELDSVLVHKQ